MDIAPMASRLLREVASAHRALSERAAAGESERRGFSAIQMAMEAALDGIGEPELSLSPSAEEWSMAEVIEHVAEHDSKYVELAGHGLQHYVEHGLEHAMQLWRMRAELFGSAEPKK